MMLEVPRLLNLKGSLKIRLDENPIEMDCEGQCIKLTFTSYSGLRKFFHCKEILFRTMHPFFTHDLLKGLSLSYYMRNVLIGKSNKDLPPTWIGKYIGLKNTKIFYKNILNNFFKR